VIGELPVLLIVMETNPPPFQAEESAKEIPALHEPVEPPPGEGLELPLLEELLEVEVEVEAAAARIQAKDGLGSYAYNLRNSITDEKLTSKFKAGDKAKLKSVIDETISWLDGSQEVSKEECEEKQKGLKVSPTQSCSDSIVLAVYLLSSLYIFSFSISRAPSPSPSRALSRPCSCSHSPDFQCVCRCLGTFMQLLRCWSEY